MPGPLVMVGDEAARANGVAVVGASERTLWTYWLLRNLAIYGYGAQVWPVNPNREEVFGVPCFADLDDIPGTPEIGVVIVRPELATNVCQRLIDLGATTIIVVSNGFRESGTDSGVTAEESLVKVCDTAGVRMIGPNCVGFASLPDGLCAIAEPVPPNMKSGIVTLSSHSGAMLSGVLGALEGEGLGVDQCFSIGNGASFDMADSLVAGVESLYTRVICAVIEGVPARDRLEEIVAAGHRAGKEFVFLLLGQSAGGRKVAQSHTGAVIGEQRIARAWLHKLGVTVATSVEELARAARLVSYIGRPHRDRGVFVIAGSGGGAGLAVDLAEKHGVPLAEISEETRDRMQESMLTGGFAGNPLDLGNRIDAAKKESLMRAICSDPSVGLLLDPYTISWPDDSEGRSWHRRGFEDLARYAREFGLPAIVSSIFDDPITPWIEDYMDRSGLVVTAGINTTMAALGRLYGSDGPSRRSSQSAPADPTQLPAVIGEDEGRDLLTAAGLPVVPGAMVADIDAASIVAARAPGPWVLKVGVPGVAHKGKVGGVKVGLWGETAVREAAEQIARAAIAAGLVDETAEVPFLMQEMHLGPEILLGAIRDEIAGPSLTVSLGGWAAEAATPFGVVSLPLSDEELAMQMGGWQLGHFLGTEKESQLIEYATGLSRAFVSGGSLSIFTVVEINPLILGPDGAVAADVLIVR